MIYEKEGLVRDMLEHVLGKIDVQSDIIIWDGESVISYAGKTPIIVTYNGGYDRREDMNVVKEFGKPYCIHELSDIVRTYASRQYR